MKNLFLALALILSVSVASATAKTNKPSSKIEKINTVKKLTRFGTCTITFTATYPSGRQESWTESYSANSLGECAAIADHRLAELRAE